MSGQVCTQHPEVPAAFRCDGCGKLLCGDCIKKGHALLFCSQCGERALPLNEGQPATVREASRREAVSKPYSFKEALFYPFRGMGLYLYIAALVSMAVVGLLLRYGFGCWPIVLALSFWSLMVGIQFSIVRTTAEGENELPEWPDYTDFGERVFDILTYIYIACLQMGPAVAYLLLRMEDLLTKEPSFVFWAGFAICAWLGSALSTMAYGAAGRFSRVSAMRLDLHIKGFLAGGADAVTATNLAFGLGICFLALRALLSKIPFVGEAASGIVGAYWFFTSAHLPGVLFRRHIFQYEKLYE